MKANKKNTIIAIVAIVLLLIAVILLFSRQSGTIDKDVKSFSIEDTAAVYQIFMADANQHQVLLQRQEDNSWLVNKMYPAMQPNVEDLLACMTNVVVKAPVAKKARENINKQMAVGSVKVEIYYTDYHINIGKIKTWKYKNKKVYYIGQQTMDNLGNYALLEGAKVPCVIYLPGFRGFVRPKYSPLEDNWRSHNIVKLKLSKIQRVESIDFENPQQSFRIEKSADQRHFDIFNMENMQLVPYDTLKLLDHLSDYRDLNYEMQETELTAEEIDSIFSRKFKEITITDIDGKSTKITMFRIETILNTDEYDYNMAFVDAFNRDKFYAIINDNPSEIFLCQFFVFDRIVQPLEYYFIDSPHKATPSLREIKEYGN